MKKYISPVAKVVKFETVDIIAASTPPDLPEVLNTWGDKIASYSSKSVNLFD